MKKILNENGFTLVEVLASIVIITIILTAVSTSFINNAKSNTILNENYSATQLCESLLTVFKEKGYGELIDVIGLDRTVPINIKNELGLDPSADVSAYTATVTLSKHPDASLQSDVVMLQVSVQMNESKPIILKGYVRK